MRTHHTEKLQDGFIKATADSNVSGCLMLRLQNTDDESADDYVQDRRYQQDDRQQSVHLHLAYTQTQWRRHTRCVRISCQENRIHNFFVYLISELFRSVRKTCSC